MQACLHSMPHDMSSVLDAVDEGKVLPAPRQQVGLWALVLALAVLSYGTHVANGNGGSGSTVADLTDSMPGSALVGIDEFLAAAYQHTHGAAAAPGRRKDGSAPAH